MGQRQRHVLRNEKGVVLVIALFVLVILLILSAAFLFQVVQESLMARHERELAKSFYIAEGGMNSALTTLNTLINTDLYNSISTTNPQLVSTRASSYVTAHDGLGFLIEFAEDNNIAQFTLSGTEARHTVSNTALGSGSFDFNIIITEKSDPVVVTVDQWDFPYNYRIESTGRSSGLPKKILLSGDFTVRIQRDNFAKYALYTDHHTTPSGGTVWFTDKTNFSGPVHTNDRLSFARNPSGVFDGVVTQHVSTARFYNQGSPILIDADYNGTYDVPTFNAGYTRSVSTVTLASSVQQQDVSNQATGGQTLTGNGIFIPTSGSNLAGGIFIRGDANVTMAVDGSENAAYTLTQGSTTKNVTVNRTTNQTIVTEVGQPTLTYNGLPDGVDNLGTIIYVDGAINALSGTVQRDTEITISSQNDIIINNNVTYQDSTAAVGTPGTAGYVPPNATDTTNLLGILSWGGNVRVGTTAPNNITIDGIVMARNGIFTVDSYSNAALGVRGTATMLGGAITQFYGGFGTFSGTTGLQLSGYGRNFVYDGRTLLGNSPPYFPSLNTFIAFTNDITDKLIWQEGDNQ